jgi:hypothetical protein
MVCPCGCGDVVQLNLLPTTRPRWRVEDHPNGTVTLFPSVWRQKGCRSHYHLRRGVIVWCSGRTGAF